MADGPVDLVWEDRAAGVLEMQEARLSVLSIPVHVKFYLRVGGLVVPLLAVLDLHGRNVARLVQLSTASETEKH